MSPWLPALGLLTLLVACRTKDETKPAAVPAAEGPVDTPRTVAPAPAPRPCDLSGDYRLRFASNGADGWWWRMRITSAGTTLRGKLTAPIPVLAIEETTAVEVHRKNPGCGMTVTAPSRLGEMTATLALEESTGQISGELTRAQPRDAGERGPTPIAGVRDVPDQPAAGPDVCVTPGTYELAFDTKAPYESDTKTETCDLRLLDRLPVRFEYLGSKLYGDALDAHGQPEWPGSIVIRSFDRDCAVGLEYLGPDGSAQVALELTFAGAEVSGTATKATYRILEDGDAGENMWNCTATAVTVTGHLL
jgi:hypothetical protein